MSKLSELRKEYINELIGLITTKGIFDKEMNEYRLNLYQGIDDEAKRIDVVGEDRFEYGMFMVWALTYKKRDGSPDIPWIETSESHQPITEIFADDLENLLEFIKGLTDEDLAECNNFADQY